MAYDNEIIVVVAEYVGKWLSPLDAENVSLQEKKVRDKLKKDGKVAVVYYDPQTGFSDSAVNEIRKLTTDPNKSTRIQIHGHGGIYDDNILCLNSKKEVNANAIAYDICNSLGSTLQTENKLRISLKICNSAVENNKNATDKEGMGKIFVNMFHKFNIKGTISARNEKIFIRPGHAKSYSLGVTSYNKKISPDLAYELFVYRSQQLKISTENFINEIFSNTGTVSTINYKKYLNNDDEIINFLKTKIQNNPNYQIEKKFIESQLKIIKNILNYYKNNPKINRKELLSYAQDVLEYEVVNAKSFNKFFKNIEFVTKSEGRKKIYSTSGKVIDADTGKIIEKQKINNKKKTNKPKLN